MMVSIVTTSTVSVVTTAQFSGTLAVIAIVVLLALLVQKEIAKDSAKGLITQFNQVFNISVVPLLIAFLLIVFFNITKHLN
jgi:hypothetical protein